MGHFWGPKSDPKRGPKVVPSRGRPYRAAGRARARARAYARASFVTILNVVQNVKNDQKPSFLTFLKKSDFWGHFGHPSETTLFQITMVKRAI